MSLSNLFYWSYWFSQPRIARGEVLWFWVLFFLVLVLAGLILKIVRVYQEDTIIKNVLRKFGNIGLTMGLLGLLWLFFRQERIPFFAWRFWLLFWIFVLALWLPQTIRYAFKRLPEIKKEKWEREMREKYLPKNKKS